VDELISLLGLEVPVAPTISLAGIKADGIILHWKPPDPRSTVNKHQVHINGINGMCGFLGMFALADGMQWERSRSKRHP